MKRTFDEFNCDRLRMIMWNFRIGDVVLECRALDTPVHGSIFQVPADGSEWVQLPLISNDEPLVLDTTPCTMILGITLNSRNYALFTPRDAHAYEYNLTVTGDTVIEAWPAWHSEPIARLEKKRAKRARKIAAFEAKHGSLKSNGLPAYPDDEPAFRAAIHALIQSYFRFKINKDTHVVTSVSVSRHFYAEQGMRAFAEHVTTMFWATLTTLPIIEKAAADYDEILAASQRVRDAEAALAALPSGSNSLTTLMTEADAIAERQRHLDFRKQ